MAVIGNDNYRPGLSPPKPVRGGTGWLSSNMAQLMVFLNGLILTIVAFSTLSIFIEEIVREGLLKTTEEVQERLLTEYESAEEVLNSLSYVLGTSNNYNSSKLKNYISKSVDRVKYFEGIYLLERNANGWSADEIFVSTKNIQQTELVKKIVSVVSKAREEDILLRGFQWNGILDENDDNAFSEPYLLKVKVEGVDGGSWSDRYVVGFGYFGHLISPEWIENKETIQTINFLSTTSNKSLYFYRKAELMKVGFDSGGQVPNNFSIKLSDFPVEVQVTMQVGARDNFLRKIPLLMLLFGITLTLIGTMYVRNNQRQSIKLSDMNKELAHKNYELSQQMSERERLSQVIQKASRDNSAIINAVSDIIFELSVDEKIVFLNDTWKKVTGFDLDQSVGRNLFDLLYYQDQEEQRDNFYQLVKGQKKPYRAYTRLRTSDGTFRSVELTISMIRQDENKDLRIVGTITDVEERRRAERALSEAEKKYRAIVENAASGIYQVTPEGQFLSANAALAKILGYDRPEDILRDILNVTDEVYVDPAAREKILREVVSSKKAKVTEIQIKRKDGTISWANEHIRPVYDDEDNLIFYEGSMEDIDQRKKAEIALREAKIESDLANRSKSEFLANMSHELRTPLNSIIGFSEIIKSQAFGDIAEPKYVEYANSIYGSGNDLLKVINEILDVSRIDASERSLSETNINVSELVSSVLISMRTKTEKSSMEVHNHIIDSALGLVGEAQAVKQMLINLLSNSIKFSQEGGVITLGAEIDSKGRLRMSVTDTGIGLTEPEIEKALSPFGQVNVDFNRDKSGAGLGLTLVKSLMRLHGGDLELVSQKNIGTTATLIFPEDRVTRSNKKETGSSEVSSESPMFENAEDIKEDL